MFLEYWRLIKLRRVQVSVIDNYFEQNKVNVFYVSFCVYLEVVIKFNRFINNMDKVLVLMNNNWCGLNKGWDFNFVKVEINENRFMKNCVDNILFIDFSFFFEMVFVIVRNNMFEDNEVVMKDFFLDFYCCLIVWVVIVFKEGSFILCENILENFKFVYQFLILCDDY